MWLTVSSEICEHVFLKRGIDKCVLKAYNDFGLDISRFTPYLTPKKSPRITYTECEILDSPTYCWILFSDKKDRESIEQTYPTWT